MRRGALHKACSSQRELGRVAPRGMRTTPLTPPPRLRKGKKKAAEEEAAESAPTKPPWAAGLQRPAEERTEGIPSSGPRREGASASRGRKISRHTLA